MATYVFDTLEQAEKLQRNGFEEKQAKGLVEVIALSTSSLVTKQDLDQSKLEMRLELQHECSNLRQEMRLGFSKLENKILSMTISLGAVYIAALGAYTYLLQWLN